MNVQCPACGTYVAETATMCPYCGFRGDDPSRPIYKQGEYRPVPIVPCEIVMDDGRRGEIWLSDEDSKNLFRHLTDWKWLSTMLPALAETLESMFGGTVHLEAKLPEHIMRMIEEGKLHFATDKNGEILAEVFDERNKIFKQVRLEKVVRNDTLLPAMQHLETQAAPISCIEKSMKSAELCNSSVRKCSRIVWPVSMLRLICSSKRVVSRAVGNVMSMYVKR